MANYNPCYFNNLVKTPCRKTPYRYPHRLNLSSQPSCFCAWLNIKMLKDKDLEFANSIRPLNETREKAVSFDSKRFLAKVRDAIRMATWTRRMRRFLLNNGAASPSRPCAGKYCKTSKPPRFTNLGQEPTFLAKHRGHTEEKCTTLSSTSQTCARRARLAVTCSLLRIVLEMGLTHAYSQI